MHAPDGYKDILIYFLDPSSVLLHNSNVTYVAGYSYKLRLKLVDEVLQSFFLQYHVDNLHFMMISPQNRRQLHKLEWFANHDTLKTYGFSVRTGTNQ
jgi:hypothetical protein